MNLFDLSLQLNGFPIRKAKHMLRDIQNRNDAEYTTYINVQRQTIVEHHLKHNSFYKQFAGNADPLKWSNIPVMTKSDLQQPLENLLSDGFSKKNVYIDKTSGASGTPFIFAKDKLCHALTWAIIKDRFGWFNLDFNSSKQARFYGIPLNKKNYYKERLKDFVSKRIRFNVFDLSDAALTNILEAFKTTHFNYINGYTSAIVQFAKFLKRKQIVLKTICPSLNVCVVTSEMLFEDDKQLMETQFGVPVVNEYGASELDLIAFENPSGKWQTNSETLFIEILDAQDNVLPLGETGRIVITSLYNKAQPFIRYDIGDLGALSIHSTPKKPILKKLTGRTNDMITLPSGKQAVGLTFYYVTKSIIEDGSNVKEFVIEQLKTNTFKINYVSPEVLSTNKIKAVEQAIETYLEKGLVLVFERQKQLQRSKSGKLKQFSSLIQPAS
ncbi:phenylacetate--CoA ligase family protein [Snuella sedimenti]|uniref:Phenylacetate--CoA ligase family protein n=1 Tax=Snuella sedimenti TaxID=2798802 RepID=A0A8J7IH72_9FLAO|nr:phenylacetate--CoA ligase family protein [Snuella sedimenti]MBJ6368178.1 phenylacetate--CoA ligase family protein [Snuella sedimenti]